MSEELKFNPCDHCEMTDACNVVGHRAKIESLEKELSEARAEIERLKADLEIKDYVPQGQYDALEKERDEWKAKYEAAREVAIKEREVALVYGAEPSLKDTAQVIDNSITAKLAEKK